MVAKLELDLYPITAGDTQLRLRPIPKTKSPNDSQAGGRICALNPPKN